MISAIVLAAGLSRRMGRFKLTLPWRDTTVIGQVVATLEAAAVAEIFVVTGHRAAEVTAVLANTSARCVFNRDYAAGEMLSSIQTGLLALNQPPTPSSEVNGQQDESTTAVSAVGHPCAALLCLGDQPQMEVTTVQAVLATGATSGWKRIIIPSFQMRAGHPILLPRWAWPAIGAGATTLREILAAHPRETEYLTVETASILADLDTPGDYERR